MPWCRYLSAQVGVEPQLYADNLKCVSRDPDLLLRAARFTTGYVRLVGQEPAPSKCVLLSTSRIVRRDMKDWVLSQEGDRWSVKFDVRDLGGHLDTTFRGWSSTLAAGVRLVVARLVLIFVLPLDFHGRVRVVRSMYLPAALHGVEASLLASDSLLKLRTSICWVVWSRRQPLASVGAVLSLLDGPTGCHPLFCVVWFRFRLFRRFLALWPSQVGRAYRLLDVRLVISRLVLIFVLPLDFHGRVRVVGSMYLPAALHGIEASLLASESLRKLRSAVRRFVWSRRQPFASVGAVLSLLDGPTRCDPAFCVVWFRFRLLRRYLWGMGVLGMVLFIFFLLALQRLAFSGILMLWLGLGLVCLCVVIWLALFKISKLLFLMLGVTRLLLIFVGGKVFGVGLFLTSMVFAAP